MTKKEKREFLFKKYNGHCAYCGDLLQKGWHVDELLPIRRNGDGTCLYPERLNLDNQMPSCPSCNINKHSMPLESFRDLIAGFVKHLTEVSVQYKVAKRYGLVKEIDKKVVFYFETITDAKTY
jgi:5-methylcytosine-specific restriction endonuclease McrA